MCAEQSGPADPAIPLRAYLDALLEENSRINLTAVRDRDQALVLHVQDSLAIGPLGLEPRHCLDLGTGNGFPGVALLALFPDAEVTLLDRTGKKIDAIGRILQHPEVLASGLRTPKLLHMDAAQMVGLEPGLRDHFDLVTARALATPTRIGRWARPVTCRGGDLVLWLDAATDAPAELSGFRLQQVHGYELPEPAARQRRLAHYRRT